MSLLGPIEGLEMVLYVVVAGIMFLLFGVTLKKGNSEKGPGER